MLVPRTKLVSFRLSEEEYMALRALSEQHGARSLSDYARSLANRAVEDSTRLGRAIENQEHPDVRELRRGIQTLQNWVEELTVELREKQRFAAAAPVGQSLNGNSHD